VSYIRQGTNNKQEQLMIEQTWYIILAIVNIPAYLLVGKLLFEDWYGFKEALVYWVKPDMWSWMSGEGMEDFFAELKLGIFVAVNIGIVIGEFHLISKYFLT